MVNGHRLGLPPPPGPRIVVVVILDDGTYREVRRLEDEDEDVDLLGWLCGRPGEDIWLFRCERAGVGWAAKLYRYLVDKVLGRKAGR
jgi:hypothetical protein